MIEINLLPGARKKKPARAASLDLSASLSGFSGAFADKVLLGSIAVALVAGGGLAWMYLTQKAEAAQIEADAEQAHADSVKFATLFAARNSAEALRDTLLRQLNLIRSIDEDRYIWPHIMDEVSRALPQYTWLTVLNYSGQAQGSVNNAALPPPPRDPPDARRPSRPRRIETTIPPDPIAIRILGQTVDIQALPRFMRQLEASPFLANVMLDVSQPASAEGQEVTQFSLTLAYQRPDTSQLRLEPLVVRLR